MKTVRPPEQKVRSSSAMLMAGIRPAGNICHADSITSCIITGNGFFKIRMSLITGILLALLIALSLEQIVHAWELLGQVNIWVLGLLIQVQIISYLAAGEMMFHYLRSKGRDERCRDTQTGTYGA